MKKFVVILATFLLIVLAYTKVPFVHSLLSYSPCSIPLTYRLGEIDPRFNLTTDQVLTNTREAANIWNNVSGKTLFTYDPEGKITINFIYDKRQELSTQLNQIQQKLDADKGNLDPQIEEYKKKSADFDQKAASLNQEVSYWNSRGGAPVDEYNQLISRQRELQEEAKELNALARNLNQSAKDYNSQIGELNQTERQFNQTLTLKPEEGLYNSSDNTIAIYFNNTQDELIHTLAHELGHARGIDHNNNSNSIMYPSSTEMITPSNDDLASLAEVCKEQSYLQLVINGYSDFLRHLRAKI